MFATPAPRREIYYMRAKQKGNWVENLIVSAMALLALGLVITTDRLGLPEKWHAAVVGTLVTFGGVGLCFPRFWRRPFFWLLMAACFAVHCLVLVLLFAVILSNVKVVGTFAWYPVAFAEGLMLLGIVTKFTRKSN